MLVAATALVFALSFDEFPITYWVSSSDSTLPVYVFSLLRRSVDPSVNAISALLMAATLSLFTLAFVFVTRAERRRAQTPLEDA
jgi:ABC-type spermidine/putrescine transport system permease subunit II